MCPAHQSHSLWLRLVCKEQTIELAKDYQNEDLRLLGHSKVDYTSSFYITRHRQKILYRDYGEIDSSAYYFVDTMRIDFPNIDRIADRELLIREHRRKVFLLKGNKLGELKK